MPNKGAHYPPGELPGSLYQSIKTRGFDQFKSMTAEEIAFEFQCDVCHVRGTAKKFGFEYRHLKVGRRKKGA